MLRDLSVRNLAVIEEATVEFDRGLNVMTGETGAGKSIVVDALALLRGARASAELLRSGADRLVVSGRFDLDAGAAAALAAAGIDSEADELVVRREIGREGRNRVFINDQPATLRLLKATTESTLQIHAQREELALATAQTQRDFVDGLGGLGGEELLAEVADRFAEYRVLADRLDRVRGDRRLHGERVDLLRFQIVEIDRATLQAGEDLALRTERERLRNSEQIAATLGRGHLELAEEDGAAVERLARTESGLRGITAWEPEAEGWLRELEELRIRLQEVAVAMRRSLDHVAADPRRQDEVEERLAVIDRLRRKYGDNVEQILEHRAASASELEMLESDMHDSAALENEVERALGRVGDAAGRLSAKRRVWARSLVEEAQAEFADLALKKARLSVEMTRRPDPQSALAVDGVTVAFGPHGYDQIELLLAANPGEEPRPLATSASGGELSRVFLALRLASRGPEKEVLTMVFDEADAGLGGEAASALGRKLQKLARGSQVLAVTHLPQIASFADAHFGVRKEVSSGRTKTSVDRLSHGERVEEVARMLAGKQQTATALSHAEELIALARR